MNNQFQKEVLEGLRRNVKHLPSKYFYDAKGDQLFQDIMSMDEYYLTRAEYEVLEANASEILNSIGSDEGFNLVEFGAGDGSKTKLLLRHFLSEGVDFSYRPIDISGTVLDQLTNALKEELPELMVKGIQQDYFSALKEIDNGHTRNVVLFLGSNIGNFSDQNARKFLSEMYRSMDYGDMALIGFDLKKDPHLILDAYNDKSGITSEFNLNLLDRINRELAGNFDRDAFMHYPLYNPLTGQAKSYIISKKAQVVEVAGESFEFKAWEAIHTEISRKFHPGETDRMAMQLGFKVVNKFFDSEQRFMDVLWEK